MITPTPQSWAEGESLGEHLESRGVSRRDFVKFCGEMAVIFGVGMAAGPRIARALQAVKRPSVIWLQLQECTGCVESVLRTAEPTIGVLLLDVVSLDYNHSLMAGAGDSVERA
jgi:[NiFe] hydrogenase small subunit